MGGSQSFGSNYHPSSQTRKMSIGVIVESLAKKRPGPTEEDETAAVETERVVSADIEITRGKINVKDTLIPEEERSPSITRRPFDLKIPTADTMPDSKIISTLPATSEERNTLDELKDATYSVHYFANQTSKLHSNDGNHKKSDVITCQRKVGRRQTTENMEEQEVPLVYGDKTENVGNRQNQTLRMRLFQILGTVSSPQSQCPFSQDQGACPNNPKQKQVADEKAEAVVKPRLNSDSIETDSECPDNAIRRPVTRSLVRNKASVERKTNEYQSGIPSNYKQKHQKKSIFSFEQGRAGGLHKAADNLTSKSTGKKSMQMKSSIKPRKLLFDENGRSSKIHKENYKRRSPLPAEKELPKKDEDKTQKAPYRSETFPPAEIISLLAKDRDLIILPPESRRKNSEHVNNTRTTDSHQSPRCGFTTPNLRKSPSLIPHTDQMGKNSYSPEPQEKKFIMGNIRSYLTLKSSKPDCFKSGRKPFDDEEGPEISKMRKAETDMEEEDNKDNPSESSIEERDSGNSIEGSPMIETYNSGRKRDTKKIEEENLLFLRPIKRFRSREGVKLNESSTKSQSLKGTGESDWIEHSLGEMRDNGLPRAVALLALSLEKLKRKMMSATTKKCSEILEAVAEGVYLQLSSAESQIQADVGKLTTLGKSTRKQLENRFQEQQEQIKLINKKFQEETKHHLQDCESIIEDLDSQQLEYRGTMEEQKVSHRKLLLEVKEAVEAQLDDAKRRIAAVQEIAREKMLLLRQAIAECLEDGD